MNVRKVCEEFGIDVGYEIRVSQEEYNKIIEAFDDAETLCDEHGSWEEMEKYKAMREELEAVKKRYLTDEEAAPIINCLCCKHCLSPFERENGRMCRLDECKFEEA